MLLYKKKNENRSSKSCENSNNLTREQTQWKFLSQLLLYHIPSRKSDSFEAKY